MFTLLETISPHSTHDYLGYVYNHPRFLAHNNDRTQIHFYAHRDDRILAHTAFLVKEGVAHSPLRLPFAGLEYNQKLDDGALRAILSEVEWRLKAKNVAEINYHQPPNSYQSDVSLNKAFESLGYGILQERLFHGIRVNEHDLIDRMHKMEQRKFNMFCNGAEFKALVGDDAIQAIKWIEKNRRLAKKPASMSWEDLKDAKALKPEAYLVFGVFMDGQMLSATVLVRANRQSVYHFLPTSLVGAEKFKKYSPMVFLVNGLYGWCQENGVELLDFGTLYVDGTLKVSLVQFKEHLGGEESRALSWRKEI